jgi:formylglycine-generating enzyme required for sulfatase activity
MKTSRNVMIVVWLGLVLLLSACGPTPTPTPVPATAPALPTETQTAVPTPTLVPVALAGPQSGDPILWLDGSTLVYVPPSEFKMGDGAFDAPEHSVTLEGYWIYKTEVTNRMYEQCVTVGSCTAPAQELGGPVYSNPDFANHPVVGVTWDQAQAYCGWTQGRLPTEAEWEKSARGLGGSAFPWGDDEPACDLLNFAYCIGHTTEVNAYPEGVSFYGALDLAGNVFEWVGDWYSETFYTGSPLVNPTGPESGDYRGVRSSSFETDPTQAGSAIRHYLAPSLHRRDTGFRCVLPKPQPLAPYCQLSAFIPTNAPTVGECQLPFTEVRGRYCSAGSGFATVDIPHGANYDVNTPSFKCTEAILDGERRLTCSGPGNSTGEITVCNPTCSNSPDVTGAAPLCDPGYTLQAGSGACNYTPILGQATVAGCPVGYVLLDRGGQKTCVTGLNANGSCPTGLYLDSLIGACVPPNGPAETPYGIDNPELAAQTYAGCAPGYTYDQTFQCCQAVTGGTYPGCVPGSTFNADLKACTPGEVKLSGPGCVTVSINIDRCSEPRDVCSHLHSEAICIRNSYACKWNEKQNVCEMKR